MIDRRRFVFAASAAGGLWVAPRLAFAEASGDRRFVFIIQRGAADGLSIVAPAADADYARLRGALAVDTSSAARLTGDFVLHPALKRTAALYAERQALFIHAVASDYRDRSHFDAQNVIETGGAAPYQVKDGWLNRLAALQPAGSESALALAATIPTALRGGAPVTSYAPSALPAAPDDLLARVERLYARDAQLGPVWTEAMAARALAGDDPERADAAGVGTLAASFLAQATGPRIAMLETGGWDTHAGQEGRLRRQLEGLDTLIGALRDGLGPVWSKTTVLVATEFGRTAAANGTGGTDHGTGSVAWVLGGSVAGGRVLGDWPGLSAAALYEGRDLRPTTALNAVFAGAAAEAMGLDPDRVAAALFDPRVRPVTGLVKA